MRPLLLVSLVLLLVLVAVSSPSASGETPSTTPTDLIKGLFEQCVNSLADTQLKGALGFFSCLGLSLADFEAAISKIPFAEIVSHVPEVEKLINEVEDDIKTGNLTAIIVVIDKIGGEVLRAIGPQFEDWLAGHVQVKIYEGELVSAKNAIYDFLNATASLDFGNSVDFDALKPLLEKLAFSLWFSLTPAEQDKIESLLYTSTQYEYSSGFEISPETCAAIRKIPKLTCIRKMDGVSLAAFANLILSGFKQTVNPTFQCGGLHNLLGVVSSTTFGLKDGFPDWMEKIDTTPFFSFLDHVLNKALDDLEGICPSQAPTSRPSIASSPTPSTTASGNGGNSTAAPTKKDVSNLKTSDSSKFASVQILLSILVVCSTLVLYTS